MESVRSWRLPRYAWLLIVPPFLAFVIANWMLSSWGGAEFAVSQPFSADGHLEAAGRLRTLATFLLYAAFAAGSMAYAVCIILKVAPSHRRRLLWACLGTLAAGTVVVGSFGLDEGDRLTEIDFACASFERLHAPVSQGPDDRAQQPKAPPRVSRSDLHCPIAKDVPFKIPDFRSDRGNSFRQLRLTYAVAAILLMIATPLLVWGAIACLALPQEGSNRERHAAWTYQTEALNRLLYITAAFLIAGLFYSSARWSWPAYSLHPSDAAAYKEHVRSLILYLGVLNSVLIASYYLPVAALLAANEPERPRAGGGAAIGAGEESRSPFAAYRAVLAILSPAILGLLGELLKFTP